VLEVVGDRTSSRGGVPDDGSRAQGRPKWRWVGLGTATKSDRDSNKKTKPRSYENGGIHLSPTKMPWCAQRELFHRTEHPEKMGPVRPAIGEFCSENRETESSRRSTERRGTSKGLKKIPPGKF